MRKNISDAEVGLLVKNALEFNADILVFCTAYYGSMESKRNQERFRKDINRSYKKYGDVIKLILNEPVEKVVELNP